MRKVMVFEPGQAYRMQEIDSIVRDGEEIVGGIMDHVTMQVGAKRYGIFVNDTGIIDGLRMNRIVNGQPLYGTFFIYGSVDKYTGEDEELTEADIKLILGTLGEN